MATSLALTQPPQFLKVLAHDLRWRMIVALARSDMRVQELVTLLKHPPNLVSYHLKQLRALKLVTERRSAADGRDVYYSLALDKIRTMYLASGQALHPALGESETETHAHEPAHTSKHVRVLFLCTHNSARSQMAEAILRHLGGGRVNVFSAGSEPSEVHPLAMRVMAEIGIDIRQQWSKHLDEFRGQTFDYVVTVCDQVRESCPVFPGHPEQIHWSFPDPAAVEGKEKQYRAFKDTATQLTTRIRFLLLSINRSQENAR